MPRISARRQAATGIIAGDTSNVQEQVNTGQETVTASNTKPEIYDYLIAQGRTADELDGLTKAQLVELL